MIESSMKLDIEAVHAFVLIAELNSFTQAADALGTTQSGVSLKIKRLEDKLDRRLLERSPRHIRLSEDGERFLTSAKRLLIAHDEALASFGSVQQRLSIGISHHIVGPELPGLLVKMFEPKPHLSLELRVANSWDVMSAFDNNKLDIAIVLQHDKTERNARTIYNEPFGWFAVPRYLHLPKIPVRIASQIAPCSIRTMSCKALEEANLEWKEVFTGGGVATVSAAVSAGLAVAAMSKYAAPTDAIDVTDALGLPALPKIGVSLHTNMVGVSKSEITSPIISALQATRR